MTKSSKTLVAAVAALLLLPAAASAAAPTGGTSTPSGAWNWALLGGLDIPTATGANVGPRVVGELMYGVGEIAPGIRLDIGPRVSFAYNGGDASLWTLDFLGTGRLSYLLDKNLSLYGEAGLGFGIYHVSVLGNSDSGGFFDILLAPGFVYALTPTLNLIGEVGFWINAKSGLGTHIVIPTVGVQWRF